MLVSMGSILERANRENYGVLAINVFNLESSYLTIKAAEEMHAPIILDLLMQHIQTDLPMEVVLPAIRRLAEAATVEVAINLDHGKDEEYVKQAIKAGFTGVMVDMSEHPYVENVRITREIVQLAHDYGVTVEAEIGAMGATAGEHFTDGDMFTDPEQAIDFIQQTGIDVCALSFGSSHGIMPEGYVPEFHCDIVEKVKKATGIPLVLHGGSGCGAENIQASVKAGINKINVGSDVMHAQANALQEQFARNPERDYVEIMATTLEPAKEVVKEYIKISGSAEKSVM